MFQDWKHLAQNHQVLSGDLPQAGGMLIFDHRELHDSEVLQGLKDKIIIRTDIIFEKGGA